ncbi:MAG: hypothetical protein MJE66_25400, partial [Proteobacteria bacterium]|nr:hypothetical protein [Pseudomonadota bacterium]
MMRALFVAVAGLVLAASVGQAQEAPTPEPDPFFVDYEARLVPTERAAHVAIRIRQTTRSLRSLRFRIDPERHIDWAGDGKLEIEGEHVSWEPPAKGGTLQYIFRVDHLRDERSYDSRCAENWALFRGDDLVPPALARTQAGAEGTSRLRLRAPDGWSVV